MRRLYKPKTLPEKIVSVDHMALMHNVDRMLKAGKFIVDLACGHKAYTRNQKTMVCPRCTEMLKRSIETGKEDYESFRAGRIRDTMVWEKDVCRFFNEPTDLAGNFKND